MSNIDDFLTNSASWWPRALKLQRFFIFKLSSLYTLSVLMCKLVRQIHVKSTAAPISLFSGIFMASERLPWLNLIAPALAILDILPQLLSLQPESKDTLTLHQHFNWKRLWQVKMSHLILGQRNAKHVQG